MHRENSPFERFDFARRVIASQHFAQHSGAAPHRIASGLARGFAFGMHHAPRAFACATRVKVKLARTVRQLPAPAAATVSNPILKLHASGRFRVFSAIWTVAPHPGAAMGARVRQSVLDVRNRLEKIATIIAVTETVAERPATRKSGAL
ncbi:MAG: hypothetical protein ACQET0_06335 [Pseudomonadota bacterium]